MRRILIIAALPALLLPTAAAARVGASGDGTLTVKQANAFSILMNVKGAVIGRCDQCTLRVTDPNPDDQFEEVVTGAERARPVNDLVTVYSGKFLKYRYIGGSFRIRLSGFGITFGLVGKGTITLVGKGTDDDGTYSVNGSDPQPLPAPPAVATVPLDSNAAP